jgi:hypothetical protein
LWKGLKQSIHRETLHLLHDTTLLLTFSSHNSANQQ